MTLLVQGDNVDTEVDPIDKNLKIKVFGVSSHQLYVNNDIKELLRDFPIDELEEYITVRKEIENE